MSHTVEEIKRETLDEEQCWSAVLTRNTLFDGAFVIAVRIHRHLLSSFVPSDGDPFVTMFFLQLPRGSIGRRFSCVQAVPSRSGSPT